MKVTSSQVYRYQKLLGHLDYLNQKQYIKAEFTGNAYANQKMFPVQLKRKNSTLELPILLAQRMALCLLDYLQIGRTYGKRP